MKHGALAQLGEHQTGSLRVGGSNPPGSIISCHGAMFMVRETAHVRSERGLHARPSAEVVKAAGKYKSEIFISNPEKDITANAKFILEVMMLIAEYKTELIINAKGPDASEAAKAVATVINEFYISEEEV